MKKISVLILLLISLTRAQEKPNYSPILFGYVRGWYQTDFSIDQGGFLIKEARLGAKGNVNEYAGYKLFVDFTRLGNLQTKATTINGVTVVTSVAASFSDYLLDADAFIKPIKNLTVDLGQFKVPFGTDNLRSGSDIDFVNRPLITNVSPGIRDIGFMTTYSMNAGVPVELKAGLFNGTGQNKSENDKTTNYAFRTVVQPVKELGVSANYYGGRLSGADVSIYNFGFDLKVGNVFFDGEYGGRSSELKSVKMISNSYFIYSYYDFDLGKSEVSHIIPAVRYEGYDPNKALSNNEINRATFGLAFEFAKIKYAQFRINYELFDFKDGTKNPNKLIVELLTKF
ncbi:MAG: porin [Ignavibacteriaceae bacterium]